MAVSKPLLTEFGIHYRLESCGLKYAITLVKGQKHYYTLNLIYLFKSLTYHYHFIRKMSHFFHIASLWVMRLTPAPGMSLLTWPKTTFRHVLSLCITICISVSTPRWFLGDMCRSLLLVLQVVYKDLQMVEMTAPYIPGFLAFRESSFLVSLVEKQVNCSSSFFLAVGPSSQEWGR